MTRLHFACRLFYTLTGTATACRQENFTDCISHAQDGEAGPLDRYGSTLPGFMIPCGSSAALIRRMASSSAPPRQPGIM